MTLAPSMNKYVKYFQNIRTIQQSLMEDAKRHNVPMIDNTYARSHSVAAI